MKSFIRRHKMLTATIVIVVFLIACSGSVRGHLVARFDVLCGNYKVLTYGINPFGEPGYARLLNDRYGIQYCPIAGCVVSSSFASYAKEYNAVSVTAAKRKFGRDVFAECKVDARKARSSMALEMPKR